MSRLIDDDKLQKAIPADEDNITGMGMTYDEMKAYNDGIDAQWKKIVNAPTIEPERKKGQWIWCTSSDHLKCSECGTRAPMYMDYADGDYQEWLSDFCPECGCEMKGFEEDE